MGGPGARHPHPLLLQLQVRDDLGEGRVGDERDVGGDVPEVFVQAGDEGAEEKLIRDLLAEVTELVNKLLEAHAIIVDRRVKLLAPKKLAVQENLALECVVGEEAVELSPNGVSVIIGGDHHVEEVLRDGGVEPADKNGVDGRPLLIVLHEAGVHGAIDVIPEIVLTEHEGEVRLLGIVRGGEVVEDDGNPGEDVEVADDDGIGTFERVGAAAAGGTGGTGGGHGRKGWCGGAGTAARQGRGRRGLGAARQGRGRRGLEAARRWLAEARAAAEVRGGGGDGIAAAAAARVRIVGMILYWKRLFWQCFTAY